MTNQPNNQPKRRTDGYEHGKEVHAFCSPPVLRKLDEMAEVNGTTRTRMASIVLTSWAFGNLVHKRPSKPGEQRAAGVTPADLEQQS